MRPAAGSRRSAWTRSTGDEVPYENLVKGYELTKDRYVLISPDELETLDPEKSRTIDIEDFVDLADIDPVYYDHPYYLVPDKGAAKAYGLLLNAMQESGASRSPASCCAPRSSWSRSGRTATARC